jgi:hypothetical protein
MESSSRFSFGNTWWSSFINLLNPLYSLTHFPNSLSLFFIFDIDAFSVLFTLTPLAYVFSSIWPFECSLAIFLIIYVVTYISPAITPGECSFTFHLVVDPLAVVNSTICPFVLSMAVNIILVEVTFVSALIRPDKFSSSVLHS